MLTSAQLHTIVVDSGFVSEGDFTEAVKMASEQQKTIPDVLVYKGLLTDEILGKLIAEYYTVPFIDLAHKSIPEDVLGTIPEEAAMTFRMVPFERNGGMLSVAMADPADLEAREFAKRKTGLSLKVFYTGDAQISSAIGQYKRNIQAVFEKLLGESESRPTVASADDAPVIKVLDTILDYAVAEGASDIHFEAEEDKLLVRYRIDGVLQDIVQLPRSVHQGIVARIKILSQLKIDEHRIPQDGRFKFKHSDSYVAFRVSILPSFYGENIVLRILAESARPLSFEELGLTGKNLELLSRNIVKPHGMILVTGPTGSGKTTTLYSVLTMLNQPEVNICTVEDPVEYSIKRVNQTQINPQAGLTFAAGLRALLRHDPDIIMVGEIRDKETAEMAIHSSLTGHLVLSTLHTNDAVGTIPRFIDMGSEGFLLASTLNIVIAQRLVRKLCSKCIESYTLPDDVKNYLSTVLPGHSLQTFYRGRGCEECGMRGYKGRIGIFELLEITEDMRHLIVGHKGTEELLQAAKENGMISLLDDGVAKASSGLTSIEEVLRVVRE